MTFGDDKPFEGIPDRALTSVPPLLMTAAATLPSLLASCIHRGGGLFKLLPCLERRDHPPGGGGHRRLVHGEWPGRLDV